MVGEHCLSHGSQHIADMPSSWVDHAVWEMMEKDRVEDGLRAVKIVSYSLRESLVDVRSRVTELTRAELDEEPKVQNLSGERDLILLQSINFRSNLIEPSCIKIGESDFR